MDTKNLLKIFYALNCILASFALAENKSTTVNVLAAVFPPFAQVDSNHEFVSGIDVQILKAIANRLDLKLNWVSTDSIAQCSATELEYVDFFYQNISQLIQITNTF